MMQSYRQLEDGKVVIYFATEAEALAFRHENLVGDGRYDPMPKASQREETRGMYYLAYAA